MKRNPSHVDSYFLMRNVHTEYVFLNKVLLINIRVGQSSTCERVETSEAENGGSSNIVIHRFQ